MPLRKGSSRAVIGSNIREMQAAGHPHNQAVAAALNTARQGKAVGGALDGKTPGRADKLPIDVPNGSHVIPADVVAALGDGNTAAGFHVLEQMFPHSRRAKLKGGGKAVSRVGINASDGEFVVVPQDVIAKGRGDQEHGHSILDHFIVSTRRRYAHKLSKLPPPER